MFSNKSREVTGERSKKLVVLSDISLSRDRLGSLCFAPMPLGLNLLSARTQAVEHATFEFIVLTSVLAFNIFLITIPVGFTNKTFTFSIIIVKKMKSAVTEDTCSG